MWNSNHVAWNHVVRKCRDGRGNNMRFLNGTPGKQTRRIQETKCTKENELYISIQSIKGI